MAFDYKKFYSELTRGLPGAVSPEEVDFLKGQTRPSRADRPDLFGDLSRVPLGREQAQNTAQRGKQASNDMQNAFNAVIEGVPAFGGGARQEGFDTYQKTEADIMKGFKSSLAPLTPVGAMTSTWEATPAGGRWVSGAQAQAKAAEDEYQNALYFKTEGKMGRKSLNENYDIPRKNALEAMIKSGGFAGGGGGGGGRASGGGEYKFGPNTQQSKKLPEVGSKEYNQRVLEGSMPGVGALNEYQKATAQSNIRGIEAQEKAAAEEAKKKQQSQQQPQAPQSTIGPVASTTSAMDNTPFKGIMTQEQYGGGLSTLKNLGL
jgi:hypothetical protein